MTKYHLDGKEFQLLCTHLGASGVHGVENGFRGLTDVKKAMEIENAWNSLEKKGYIESDFDGNSTVVPELLQLVKICAFGKNLILVNCFEHAKDSVCVNYYNLEGQIASVQNEDEGYQIRTVTVEEMTKQIRQILPTNLKKSLLSGYGQIPKKKLKAIGMLVCLGRKEDASKKLLSYVSEDAAELILDALAQKGGLFSVIAANYTKKEDSVRTLQYITGEKGQIRMVSKIVGLESELEFVPVSAEDVENFLNEACGSMKW